MASEVCRVLETVASSFIDQGKPLEAAKCLQAILSSGKAEFPQIEAEVRLKVAELLLGHTHNVKEALKMLERADWLLNKMTGCQSLRCAVLSRLVECYQLLGMQKQLLPACETALKLAQNGKWTAETSQDITEWVLHFSTTLAEIYAAADDIDKALVHLRDSIQVATEANLPETKALLLLGVLQLHVQHGNVDAIPKATQEAAEAIIGLERLSESRPATEPHLKLHFEVLRAAWLLSRGETIQLQKKGQTAEGSTSGFPVTVMQLQQLAKESAECKAEFGVLPGKALPALAEVIAAAIWRPTGKFSKARAHLEAAQTYIRAAEIASRISLAEGEGKLPLQWRRNAQQLAWVQYVIFENLAIIAITKQELDKAGELLQQLLSLLKAFPSLQPQLKAGVHFLSGSYCSETGESKAAVRHYMQALACSKSRQERQNAAASAALCLLGQPENPQAAPRAMDILKQQDLFCAGSGAQAPPESAAGFYASALVLLEQGNSNEGRTFIMKALKLAHAPLHNHQLVAKIMCALVPSHMDNDLSAVQSMTNTALSLSKGLADLPTQIEAAEYTLEWMEKAGGSDKLGEQKQYIARKRQQLQEAVSKATANSAQHAAIASWGSENAVA